MKQLCESQEEISERDSNLALLKSGKIQELPKIEADQKYCNGRNAEKSSYCKHQAGWGTAHRGAGRCKLHGGNSHAGIAHHSFRGRGYAKSLPSHIAIKFEEAMEDAKWIRLRSEIALCDARLHELTESLNRIATTDTYKDAVKKFRLMREAFTRGDSKGIVFLEELGELLNEIERNARTWDEIGNWLDRRQRLTEAEVRHAVHTQSVMTARDVMMLVDHITRIVKENVPDRNQLNRIATQIAMLLPTRDQAEQIYGVDAVAKAIGVEQTV